MGTSGPPPDATVDDALAVFVGADRPCTPFTPTEVAEKLGCTRRTACRKLQKLTDRGEIESKETGDRSRVWWRPPTADESDGGDGALTDRERLAAELEESEHRYRTLVENFPNGAVGLFDEAFEYTAVGGQLLDELGVAPEDRIGRSIHQLHPDSLLEQIEPSFQAALDGETDSFEVEYQGRHLHARTLPVRDADDEISAGMLVVQDVTERRERERALERYETIIESVDEGVYVVDSERNFTWVNETYAEMLGYSREELIGENATMIVDDDVIREAEVVEEEEGPENLPRMDVELWTADGDRVPVEAASTVLPGGEESDWFRAGVVRDITERKERERELEESNERLEQFAYAASHDLQEPLRMVSSYLQLVERRYADELDEEGREFIEFAVDGADRMREMVEGLLQYSRIETQGDPFESVDLGGVLANVRQDLQVKIEESDAEITVEDLPRVYGDGSQLTQVFQNLLDNAIEYSGDAPPRIHVAAERADESDEWVISVRDEGIGIDPEKADRVFGVFRSLQGHEDAGAGIGLALCERIVERHGGDIWVESAPDEGATFSFTLPAASESDE